MSNYLEEEDSKEAGNLINNASEAVEKLAGTYRKFPIEFERLIFVGLVIGSYFLGKNDMKELYKNCQKINDEILKMSITNVLSNQVKKEENYILNKQVDSLKLENDSLIEDFGSFKTLKSEIKKPIEKILK